MSILSDRRMYCNFCHSSRHEAENCPELAVHASQQYSKNMGTGVEQMPPQQAQEKFRSAADREGYDVVYPMAANPHGSPRRGFSLTALITCMVVAFILGGILIGNVRVAGEHLQVITLQTRLAKQTDETRKANEQIDHDGWEYSTQRQALVTCQDQLTAVRDAVNDASARAQAQSTMNPSAGQVLTVLRILKTLM